MRFSSKTVLAAAAALPLATAQTTTSCNPLEKSCPSDSGMGSSLKTSFTGVSSLPAGWSTTAGSLSYDSSGAKFVINKEGDAPTIQTSDYFFFGYAEVVMQAASGQGIVSSIVMESDDLDEIDWEFTGTDTTQTQTNYFGKGDTTTYDRAIWYPVSTPQNSFHSYAVNWTSSQITWLIDGVAVRTLNYADAKGGSRFPQTPMRLKIGIWAGGDPNNGEGTIEWAGGKTDFSQAPFTMTVQSVNLVNYSPASSYSYGDNTGSWTSIKVTGGSTDSNSQSGSSSSSSGSGSAKAQPSSSTVSGSAAIKVSTAASSISSSTSGGVTSSAVLTEFPLLSSTTVSTATASPTSLATITRSNSTGTGNSSVATPTATRTSSASASAGVAAFNVGSTLSAGAVVAAVFAFFF